MFSAANIKVGSAENVVLFELVEVVELSVEDGRVLLVVDEEEGLTELEVDEEVDEEEGFAEVELVEEDVVNVDEDLTEVDVD